MIKAPKLTITARPPLIAFVNPKTHEVKGNIDIPDMLSILSYHKTTGSVKGMEEIVDNVGCE